jgi:hypothetical protein
MVLAFVAVALFYMLGGSDAIRRLRARWRAFQQPPAIEQMRAPVEPVAPLRATLPQEMVRGKMWLSDSPRPLSIAIVLTTIIMGAVGAMYVTGRPGRRS